MPGREVRRFLGRLCVLLATAVLAGCEQPAETPRPPMNEGAFWSHIARVVGPGSDEEHAGRLASALSTLSADELVAFDRHYQAHFDQAGTGDLWAAGVLLNGGFGSDDGFEYFRNWLIAQGRDVFESALVRPDSLADVSVEMVDGMPAAQWELFGYVAAETYREKTGSDLPDAPLEPDLIEPRFEWADYTDDVIAARLPRLWAKFGELKVRSDQEVEALIAEEEARMRANEVPVPGLGIVKAGVILEHRKFGPGTVLGVERVEDGVMIRISFAGEVRPMYLAEPFMEQWTRR